MAIIPYGINIHFRDTGPYNIVSLNTQLQRIKDMGLTHVRVDVYDGSASTISRLNALNVAAMAKGLIVTPVFVEPNGSYISSETVVYNWCYAEARKLALAFPTMWFEAGNELNFKCIKPGVTGEIANDFNTPAYLIVKSAIKGMIAGFKSVSSTPVCVCTAGVQFGFLDKLKADGVVWDVTGWHIYPFVNATVTEINTGANLWLTRLKTFNKPIAITEFNQQDGHLSTNSAQTLINVMNAIENNAVSKNVIIAYLYELLDEPSLSGGETTYGLCNSSGVLNSLGQAVQTKIQG